MGLLGKLFGSKSTGMEGLNLVQLSDILVDDNAGYQKWKDAFDTANARNLRGKYPSNYFAFQFLGVWRDLIRVSDKDASLIYNAEQLVYYDALNLDDGNEAEEASDLTANITVEFSGVFEEIYNIVLEKDDKKFIDVFFLAECLYYGHGVKKDYRKMMLSVNWAYDLNEEERGPGYEDNKEALEILDYICNKKVEEIAADIDTILDDGEDYDTWLAAAENIEKKADYLEEFVQASHIASLYRGLLDPGEKDNYNTLTQENTYIAWYFGDSHSMRVLELHDKLSEALPGIYTDSAADAENNGTMGGLLYLATMYLRGWGVEADLDTARSYAESFIDSALDDRGNIREEYEEIVAMLKEAIEGLN